MAEWFVPKFGSRNFRLSVGILFLPYTGMVVSFAIWGSLSMEFSLDRLISIGLLYFFAIGISAHCLDALGSKKKPWGTLSKTKLWAAGSINNFLDHIFLHWNIFYIFRFLAFNSNRNCRSVFSFCI
jgi:hypothetical protein